MNIDRIKALDFTVFADPDHEECGLILMSISRRNYVLVPVPNRTDDAGEHGLITQRDVLKALDKHPYSYVVGLVHTHREHHDSEPSSYDLTELPANHFGIVYHPHSRSITTYEAGRVTHRFRI